MAVPVEKRQQAVEAYLNKEGSYRAVAERFGVDKGSLGRWVKMFRETGNSRHEYTSVCGGDVCFCRAIASKASMLPQRATDP